MKPGTFTKMYVHIVFAVKYREALLTDNIRSKVFEYISGIVTNLKHKSIIINGYRDHIHILIGLNPSVSVSDTVHDIKRSSSLFINENRMCQSRFSWQEGYGAFTYSRSDLDNVYKYIYNQESHHSKHSFREEYVSLLELAGIDYNTDFLFGFIENSESQNEK
jgi:REP element-mobilizing transposase RayT